MPATIDLASLGAAGIRIFGADSGDQSGFSVSSAGDVNGDGFDDLLIGAYRADASANAKSSAGDSYVIFGGASLPATIDLANLGTAGITIFGAESSDQSGFSVSSAGDVNGDGFDDLLIGARYGDALANSKFSAGDSYVIFGKASLPSTINLFNPLGSAGVAIFGAESGDQSGFSVSSAGDVNGDGFDDLLIGATRGDATGNLKTDAGDSYVIFGKASLPASINLASLGAAGITISGRDAGDQTGTSVSSAGDVNGDGFDDLLLGAPLADGALNFEADAGNSYVIYGGNSFTLSIVPANLGTNVSNLITGTAGAEILNGADGNDTLVGGGGADVLLGGRGDDVLAVSSLTFRRIVGGNGSDTLRLDGSSQTLNLTTLADNRILGVETIDITGSGDNTLTLNLQEVLNISDESNTLLVRRNIGDTVNMGTGWTQGANQTIGADTFEVFTQGAATLKVQTVAAPVVDLDGAGGTESFTRAFLENGGPVNITDSDATITDADSANLASLKLVVTANPDGFLERMYFDGGPGFTLGADATSTRTIGSTTFKVDYVAATRTFTVTNNAGGNAPIGDFQTLLRAVTYENIDDTPTTSDRTVAITANDGSRDSAVATATITLAATNDAPTLTAFGAAVDTTNQGTEVEIAFAELLAQGDEADVDGTVDAFVVQAVSTGTLKIGASASTAIPFAANTNDLIDGTNKAYWTPATGVIGNGINAFTVVSRDNLGAQSTGAVQVTVNVTAVDDIAPTATVRPLPLTTTIPTITLTIDTNDPAGAVGNPASGVASYDVYVAVDSGAWSLFADDVPASQSTLNFTPSSNHRYWFRAVAKDHAGNTEVESATPLAEANTFVTDVEGPNTAVTSATPDANGLFTLNLQGSDVGGSTVNRFRVFVKIDDGTAVEIPQTNVAAGAANGSGVQAATTNYQGLRDGVSHTYTFFTRGIDSKGNLEATPTDANADIRQTHTFATPVALAATDIEVQNGQTQRSYIRNVDLLFNDTNGLQALIDNNRIRVERFDLLTSAPTAGTGTIVNISGATVSGNSIKLDFGAGGLGGVGRAGNGFYRILVDTDGDGSFNDSMFEFFRLYGDSNGDGKVTSADGTVTEDLTGDGLVNATDRSIWRRETSFKLLDELFVHLDD